MMAKYWTVEFLWILLFVLTVSLAYVIEPLDVQCECPPGHGVTNPCTNTTDAVCELCTSGFYSHHPEHACHPCSHCGDGLYELRACNSTDDVFCEECIWKDATENEDFILKCEDVDQMDDVQNNDTIPDIVNDIPTTGANNTQDASGDAIVEDASSSDTNVYEIYGDLLLDQVDDQPEVGDLMEEQTDEIILVKEEQEQNNMDLGSGDADTGINDLTDFGSGEINPLDLYQVTTSDFMEFYEDDLVVYLTGTEPTEDTAHNAGAGAGAGGVEDHSVAGNVDESDDDDTDGIEDNVAVIHDNDEDIAGNSSESTDQADLLMANAGETKEPVEISEGQPTSVFSIVMAAITSGVIFFGIGFWFTRCRKKKAVYTPSFVRQRNQVDDVGAFNQDPVYNDPNYSVPSPAYSKFAMLREKREKQQEQEHYPLVKSSEVTDNNMNNQKEKQHPDHTDDYEDVECQKALLESDGLSTAGDEDEVKEPIVSEPSLLDEIGTSIDSITKQKLLDKEKDDTLGRSKTPEATGHPEQRIDPPQDTPVTPANGDIQREIAPALYAKPDINYDDNKSYQSPVNIDTNDTVVDERFEEKALTFFYVPENTRNISNTGIVVRVHIDGKGSLLMGGPLGQKRFCLHHIDFRWGSTNEHGSEHTVNGKIYSGEIQLVHWNRDDYENYEEAFVGDEGLAVMAVFIQVGSDYHDGFGAITRSLSQIRYKNQTSDLLTDFNPALLLPDNSFDYWTYPGSMTSPPYNENVTWIIYKCPIDISTDQIGSLRRLKRYEERYSTNVLQSRKSSMIANSNRRECPLGGRVVKASFI